MSFDRDGVCCLTVVLQCLCFLGVDLNPILLLLCDKTFQPHAAHVTMQCLGREWVIILGFPPVMYLSSNWGGYLR